MLTYEETAGSMASKARKAAFISGARVRVAKDAGRTGVMTGTNAAEVIAMMESMIAQRCGSCGKKCGHFLKVSERNFV